MQQLGSPEVECVAFATPPIVTKVLVGVVCRTQTLLSHCPPLASRLGVEYRRGQPSMPMVVPARCFWLQNWSQLHPTSSNCWLVQDLALGCQDYITTVVYQHDVIPRASLAGFEALRQEMLATQWEDNLTADVSTLSSFIHSHLEGLFMACRAFYQV